MTAQPATAKKEPTLKAFGKKSVQDSEAKPHESEVAVPALSNDNAGHHLTPDWSIFSANKLHPIAGKAQIILSVIGLAFGMLYALSSLGGLVIPASLTMAVFSYLTYGLIGVVCGYFAIWILGGAILLSPVLLIAALFM